MPKKNRMNSVNTKSDGSCSGILVVIIILIIIVIIGGMMSRKKRFKCEYYKDQQLTTDQQCSTDKPCKSNTTNNCMKKLNDVCPGCTTDQAPGPAPSIKHPECVEAPWNPFMKSIGDYGNVNPKIYKIFPNYKIVPSDHAGGGLGGVQSNFIGPFTHVGGNTSNNQYGNPSKQKGADGDNWGGGSEWWGRYGTTPDGKSQIYPFPIYYYARFLGALNGDKGIYNSVDTNEWKVCDLTHIPTNKTQPSPSAMDCINNKIIQPAVTQAVNAANAALDALKSNVNFKKHFENISPLTLDEVLDKSTDIWGIAPSANSTNALYNYYTATTADKTIIQNSYMFAVQKCPIRPPTDTDTSIPLKDIAQAWMVSVGGTDSMLPELYEQRFRDCPAALIVISGETSCTGSKGDFNNLTCKNVEHGVWQVTSPDSMPISAGCTDGDKTCLKNSKVCNADILNNNVCCQADWVNTHLYTDQSYEISSFGMFNKGYGSCGWQPANTQRYCTNNPQMKCGSGGSSGSGGSGSCECIDKSKTCGKSPTLCSSVSNTTICNNTTATWGCQWKD